MVQDVYTIVGWGIEVDGTRSIVVGHWVEKATVGLETARVNAARRETSGSTVKVDLFNGNAAEAIKAGSTVTTAGIVGKGDVSHIVTVAEVALSGAAVDFLGDGRDSRRDRHLNGPTPSVGNTAEPCEAVGLFVVHVKDSPRGFTALKRAPLRAGKASLG